MRYFMKYIYLLIMLFIILTACNTTDNIDEADNTQIASKSQIEASTEMPTFSVDDTESYMKYITNISEFKPYYKTVFAFEMLSNGISSVPIEKVKNMYNEMKDTFDYILVNEYPLLYIGYYEGETSFVSGYEQYQSLKTADVNTKIRNPINTIAHDLDGNEIVVTPLKTVILGESIFKNFDDSISDGRNLQMSDFILESPDKPISVVLGNKYKEFYELGDIISLKLISEIMDFQVVGFYKPNVNFSMDIAAQHQVNFDYAIIMPHFMPNYKPIGESAIFQHAYFIAEKTSGYIAITEPITEIDDNVYTKYVDTLNEMANRNGLSGLYKLPYWPVGFVW